MPKHLELIFPSNVAPGDVEIVEAATETGPGRAKLIAARITAVNGGSGCRVFSANGGAFFGVIGYGPPDPPFILTYWLEESNGH